MTEKGKPKGVAGTTARGGAWLFLARGSSLLVNLVAHLLLLRMLGASGPSVFGLFGMVWAALLIALAASGGHRIAHVLLTDEERSPERTAGVLRVAFGHGLVCAAIGGISAPVAVWFFGTGRILLPILLLSATLPVIVTGTVPRALLQREFRFRTLAAVEAGAVFVAAGAGLGTTWLGAGLWGLVVLRGGRLFLEGCLLWAIARPPLGPAPDEKEEVRRYGRSVIVAYGLNTLYRTADDVVVGRVWGDAALGFYALGYRILLAPLQTLTSAAADAAQSTLSTFPENHERLRKGLLRLVRLLASVAFPVYLGAAVAAEDLAIGLLGEPWRAAVPIIRILALAGCVQSLPPLFEILFFVKSKPGAFARTLALAGPFQLGGILVGAPFGPEGVALGLLGGSILSAPLLVGVPWRLVDGRPGELLGSLLRPLGLGTGIALAIGAVAYLGRFLEWSPFIRLLSEMGTGALLLGSLLWLLEPEVVRIFGRGSPQPVGQSE